ncbi:cytochrome b/b6 domain-containing protein [Hymenobacter sp. BT491]|uniref:cytochrome b/b6 domain-containing protein n=1 Tax=Hymenobacter sp. BT491 TaxID=2766779 RepID=UPI001653D814|nr:cytochrome b/b6 domain-containing protein [Hymenobacter sp. BT491]MBC6988882.1 cytochrome b/b6 domain-containing protein [Hymenobacter sp. BT491]
MRARYPSTLDTIRHKGWVRASHWIVTVSFFALAFSGAEILMVHPRLYWGDTGNDLTPALFEVPISRNYQHGGWEKTARFFNTPGSPVSASRTYDIFNKNGWGRSLHFLAAWFLVVTGTGYLLAGLFTGHFKDRLWPRSREFRLHLFWRDLLDHFRPLSQAATQSPHYGLLQKCTYFGVVAFLLPLAALTGLTMSPAITAAHPFLLKLFAGAQSARTLHFFASVALLLFLLVHVVMVIRSGFKRQMRGMTLGK